MTAQTLITAALEALYAQKAPGRTPATLELNRGLLILNRMIDSSNTSRANIFTERIDQWPTVNQQQSYTLGPGGNWNGPRPQRIHKANLLLPTNPTVRRHLKIWDDTQWAAITLQAIYTYPEGLYCDYGFSNSQCNVYFKPIPDGVYQVELFTWQANAAAPDLTTNILFPPGYEEYWVYNLAERYASVRGLAVPPSVADLARKGRQGIQRMNTVAPRLKTDPELRGGGGLYNWLSGLRDDDDQ